jgi:hypothetical protein
VTRQEQRNFYTCGFLDWVSPPPPQQHEYS